MNSTETTGAPRTAKISLLFAVATILLSIVETTLPPFRDLFPVSAPFRMGALFSWVVGAAAAVYFGIRSLRDRQRGDRLSAVLSVSGITMGGAVLALFIAGIFFGILSR
jgi:hypothetical protein